MNFVNKINSLFPLRAEVTLAISSLLGLVTLVAAVIYGELTFNNPFWILCCFILLNFLARRLTSDFVRISNPETAKSLTLGAMELITGVLLVGCAFSLEDREVEAVLWVVIALWLIETGVRNLGHAIYLTRANRRKQLQTLLDHKERMRIEQEIATRWAMEEATRKRKALIEEELMADLESFLGSPDPNG